jgi:hypothetical protein
MIYENRLNSKSDSTAKYLVLIGDFLNFEQLGKSPGVVYFSGICDAIYVAHLGPKIVRENIHDPEWGAEFSKRSSSFLAYPPSSRARMPGSCNTVSVRVPLLREAQTARHPSLYLQL